MTALYKLDDHLFALIKLIKLLIPNSIPSDIDRIESSFEEISLNYNKAVQLNLFSRFEEILFEQKEEITKGLLKRVLSNILEHKSGWNQYYNRKTFLMADHKIFLYRNEEFKYLIHRTNRLIRTALIDIAKFNKNYLTSEIQSNELDLLLKWPSGVTVVIKCDPNELGRILKHTNGIVYQKVNLFITDLLEMTISYDEAGYKDMSGSILSKHFPKESNFPNYCDMIYLTFDLFEFYDSKHLNRLKDSFDDILLEIAELSIPTRNMIINDLELILGNLTILSNHLIASHLDFMHKKISSKELWPIFETIFHFPDSDKVIVDVNEIKFMVLAFVQRKDLLKSLIDEIQTIMEFQSEVGIRYAVNKEINNDAKNKFHSKQDQDPESKNSVPISSDTSTKKKTRTPDPRPFPQHLNYKDQDELAEALRTSFKGKKGKAIRLMFEGLKKNNCISLESGEFKDHIDSFKDYVNWDIGSYQAIQNYNFDSKPKEKEKLLKEAEERIKRIIQSIEK